MVPSEFSDLMAGLSLLKPAIQHILRCTEIPAFITAFGTWRARFPRLTFPLPGGIDDAIVSTDARRQPGNQKQSEDFTGPASLGSSRIEADRNPSVHLVLVPGRARPQQRAARHSRVGRRIAHGTRQIDA